MRCGTLLTPPLDIFTEDRQAGRVRQHSFAVAVTPLAVPANVHHATEREGHPMCHLEQ